MDEAWERAVEAALGGQAESSSSSLPPAAPRSLTLDGAVKCLQGRLPPPAILERYQTLEHLSIANVGVSSLEKFPRLRNLRRLILSDNRIAGGLEFLVEAGLDSLRDLDLSNNRIQYLEDLAPLARLRLVSLDLYECPVTRVKDYRQRVFAMIRTLRYLDKTDADENERLESDDEEDEDDEDDEEEEEDPGSGEVDGEDRNGRLVNGNGRVVGDVLDADEDEESDADEEEAEVDGGPQVNGRSAHPHLSNGFRLAPVEVASEEEEDVDDDDEDDDDDLGEEIDEDEGEEEDVVEVHDVGDSDEDVDGVEGEGEEEVDEDDDEDEDIDGEEEEEDVEDEEDMEPESTGRMTSTEGEIDGHEQGEGDDDENDNGEIGEEDELGVDEDGDFEVDGEDDDEDEGDDFLVQPIAQPADEVGGSDFDVHNEEDDEEDEVDDDDQPHSNGVLAHHPSVQLNKRKRDEDEDVDDDSVEDSKKSSKSH